MGDRL